MSDKPTDAGLAVGHYAYFDLGAYQKAKSTKVIVGNLDKLAAERDKLRKALSDILEAWESVDGCPGKTIVEIARAALKGEP